MVDPAEDRVGVLLQAILFLTVVPEVKQAITRWGVVAQVGFQEPMDLMEQVQFIHYVETEGVVEELAVRQVHLAQVETAGAALAEVEAELLSTA